LQDKLYESLAYSHVSGSCNNNHNDKKVKNDVSSSPSCLSHTKYPLQNVTIVVTGPTSGIGLGLTRKLHSLGGTILAIGRSLDKLQALKLELDGHETDDKRKPRPRGVDEDMNVDMDVDANIGKIIPIVADLTDLDAVSRASNEILRKIHTYGHGNSGSIDYLINNAGVHHTNVPMRQTKQGYDTVFAVNYLSHFLLTETLIPLLDKSTMAGAPRIIQISSSMHAEVSASDLLIPSTSSSSSSDNSSSQPSASLPLNTFRHLEHSYANSKLAQIYHARALTSKLSKHQHQKSKNKNKNSRIQVINVCPTWVGTSIAGGTDPETMTFFSNLRSNLLHALGYLSDGYGLSSILYAMFDDTHVGQSVVVDSTISTTTTTTTQQDYVISCVLSRPLHKVTKLLGYYPWMESIGLRQAIIWGCSLLTLPIQKFFPAVSTASSSVESYDEKVAEELYLWSQNAVKPWL